MTSAPKIPASVATMIGKQFGRLRVVGADYQPGIDKKDASGHRVQRAAKIDCVCSCGAEASVSIRSLLNGHTQSCGCLHNDVSAAVARRRHRVGLAPSRLFIEDAEW